MQADYLILPKRNGKKDGFFKNLNVVKFFTNYYDIQVDLKNQKLYQYSFQLPQDIPHQSIIYHKAIMSVKKGLKQKLGYLIHSGQMIWGTIPIISSTITCKFTFHHNEYNFQALVKITKQISLKDLEQKQLRQQYLQILNINLKNTLKALDLKQLGKKGQYFSKQMQQQSEGRTLIQQFGLNILKGYRFTLTYLNSGLYLQIDICSRVLQTENLLETFQKMTKDEIIQNCPGMIVIANYGNYKTYKIQQVDYQLSPKSKFQNDKIGKSISYQQYFKSVYGKIIQSSKQPLIKVIKSIQKIKDTQGKITQQKEYVYLVPELVSLTGMKKYQKEDKQCMKAIAPFTRLTPMERVRQCSKIIQKFNNQKSNIIIKNCKKLEGYCLNRPSLQYQGATIIEPDIKGNIKYRGILKQHCHFKDWVFVYSQHKNGYSDQQQAEDAVILLRKSGATYKIQFNNPIFLKLNTSQVGQWKQAIKNQIQKKKSIQIIVLYLTHFEQKNYQSLKRYITNDLKYPSQFIKRKTLQNPKGAMSSASKIAIQMNTKAGYAPWSVQKGHPYFKSKQIMYGALSISKGIKGYTLAFVGTINNQCTKVHSQCKVGLKSKQNIPVDVLSKIFVNWAKSYYQTNNRKVPDIILLYRQGLSIPQIKDQITKSEIPALQSMIQMIGKRTSTVNYRPEVMIVTVNKKASSRFFNIGKDTPQHHNKFVSQIFNADSGSIIIEQLSQDNSYDFHLTAQYVTQGTSNPTMFRVAYDTTKMPEQALINFSFGQCFNYYNWEGAVKVPACLQCADKLSKLVSMYIKEDIVQSELTKKHFFL